MRGRVKNRVLGAFCVVFFVIALATFLYAQNIRPEIEQAIAAGDTTKALTLLDGDISIDPANPWNYYTKGMIFYQQGKYAKAAEEFEAALNKRGKHFESLYQLALCYLNLGDLDRAQKLMDEGRKKDKKNEHMFEDGYGMVMLARKNWMEADRAFRQAIVGDSTNAQYHIHLGDASFYQGIAALAILQYEKALQMDTGSLEVYYHWAEACLETKDYNCAIEKLRIVLTKDSTHANAWMRAGGIYFKAGLSSRDRQERAERFKDAIGSYKKYLELSGAGPDSSNARVFFELAMSYSNLRGYEDAAMYFDKVLTIPVEARDIYFHYGQALWYNKEYEKSAEMLMKHLDWVSRQKESSYSSVVDSSEVYQLLGDSYYYRKPKDFASAIEYYKKSLEIRPGQDRVLQNLAVAYHSLQSYAQALEYYQMRIELGIDSNSASILSNAGKCALSIAYTAGEGGEEEMIEEDMAEPSVPVDPKEYYQLAADMFTRYLDLVPTDTGVLDQLATTYVYRLSDCANGVKYAEKLLALDPNNCNASKALGHAYFFENVCSKDYTKALRYFLKAHECVTATGSECQEFGLMLNIAQAYHLRAVQKTEQKQDAQDDFRNANTWYGRCLKCNPNSKEAKEGKDQTEYEF